MATPLPHSQRQAHVRDGSLCLPDQHTEEGVAEQQLQTAEGGGGRMRLGREGGREGGGRGEGGREGERREGGREWGREGGREKGGREGGRERGTGTIIQCVVHVRNTQAIPG